MPQPTAGSTAIATTALSNNNELPSPAISLADPANFEFYASDPAGLTPLGTFTRKRSITDKYVMDLSGDAMRRFDRRLAASMGVLLDTAEAR
jgi:hypothetical protein